MAACRSCTKCGLVKPLHEFYRDERFPDGRRRYCAECARKARRENGHKTRRAAGVRQIGSLNSCKRCSDPFVLTNPRQVYCLDCGPIVADEKAKLAARRRKPQSYQEAKKYQDRYREKNRDKVRERARKLAQRPSAKVRAAELARQRRAADHAFRLHGRIGAGVRGSLRTGKSGRSWEAILGFTLPDLMAHLESKFLPGMSWNNMDEWEVDHIVPKRAFTFKDENDPAFKACWALENLQPLWTVDNRVKSGKIGAQWQLQSSG